MSEDKLAKRDEQTISPEILENLIIGGDLSKLTSEQRTQYYIALCKSMKLNPMSQPFEYIHLNGKLTLYAKKAATEQIGKNNKISVTDLKTEFTDHVVIVTTYLSSPTGRTMISTGVVNIKGQVGDMLANAVMKAETKSYRRGILKTVGLGFMDESELESVTYQGYSTQPIIVGQSQNTNGLDQWKCLRTTALAVLQACDICEKAGATIDQIKSYLPEGTTSRKDLDEQQANAFIESLRQFYLKDLVAKKSQPEGGQASA